VEPGGAEGVLGGGPGAAFLTHEEWLGAGAGAGSSAVERRGTPSVAAVASCCSGRSETALLLACTLKGLRSIPRTSKVESSACVCGPGLLIENHSLLGCDFCFTLNARSCLRARCLCTLATARCFAAKAAAASSTLELPAPTRMRHTEAGSCVQLRAGNQPRCCLERRGGISPLKRASNSSVSTPLSTSLPQSVICDFRSGLANT
jgi:hypothetical protein